MYPIHQPFFPLTLAASVASKKCLHRLKRRQKGTYSQEDGKMGHQGTLRDYRFSDAAEDIRGATLYGLNDEKLGTIDDVIFDHSTGLIRYVVVKPYNVAPRISSAA